MFNFRTDLADERRDLYKKANKLDDKIEGIDVQNEEINENLKVTKVKITSEEGENAIGKPIGDYITIDIKNIKIIDSDELQKSAEIVSKELKELINKHTDSQDEILVVGLGNIYVTPDALGPKVINDIDVTRHIIKYFPEYIEEDE